MYNYCEIFVNKNTEQLGINLKNILKYLHISSNINKLIINDEFIKNLKIDQCVIILYTNNFIKNLHITNTHQIYYFLIEKSSVSLVLNHFYNVITNVKENKHRFLVPSKPLEDNTECKNLDNFHIMKALSQCFLKNIQFDIFHNFATQYNYENIKKVLSILKKDNKEKHRYVCYHNINLIRNLEIKNFGLNISKETVLIEFRNFPHIEFLLRNTIVKLSQEWNHTVVCGKENYNLVKSICENICKNISSKINIIKLAYNNLNRDEYCELLTSNYFWSLFKGENILLYQEDTFLFHGNIDPFLIYDYIGAPWKKSQDDNLKHVGNGGFSLRKKSAMLRVINLKRNLEIAESTKRYMKNTNLKCIPEDVYFSKSLIDYNLGLVSDYDHALSFSQESIKGINPMGGHSFWLAEPNKKIINTYKLYDPNYYLTVNHRGGWKAIITNLIQKNIISYDSFNNFINNEILLLDIVEKFFLWEKNEKIIDKEWVGIIHIVPNTPDYLKNIQIENLLSNVYFIKSLDNCRGLIVLSNYLLNYLKYKLQNIKIKSIKHPTIVTNIIKFNIDTFKSKLKEKKVKVVQLGSQLRYLSTIYKLKTNYSKLWLPGRNDTKSLFYWLSCECETFNINISQYEHESVQLYYTYNFNEYDQIILNNIIIIHLINASANNAILELISLNIPFFINKLDAVIEYIGNDYPLYFNKIEEIEYILKNEELLLTKISKASIYLSNLNKSEISIHHFNSKILNFINE